MKKLYTIGINKLSKEILKDSNGKWFEFHDVNVNKIKMIVMFCQGEKGMYVIAGTAEVGQAYKVGKRWHSGKTFYNIYFRKNFSTKEEGNAFFRKVKATMEI